MCYREGSGLSKRRISSVNVTNYILKNNMYLNKSLARPKMSLIYTFQILKAPRKSIRFPDPEQQENVVGILLDFFLSSINIEVLCLKKPPNILVAN